MKTIIILGYMCAGKTSVGHALAAALKKPFYDLDWYIEGRFRKRVAEIFAEQGEAHFRDLEQRMLHEVAEFEGIVLSCGGGTPCHFDNMDYMNSVGDTVYLKASIPTLLRHLALARTERPLLKDKSPEELEAYIRGQLEEREPFYAQAHHVVEIEPMETTQSVVHVVEAVRQAVGV